MKQILSILATILGIFFFGYRKGKTAKEKEDLYKTIDEVKIANEIKENNSKLDYKSIIDGL